MRRLAAFALLSVSLLSAAAAAQEPEEDRRYVSALRSLSINRSLLDKYETEYRSLEASEPLEVDGKNAKRLSDLGYKIQALNEDAKRLRRTLPSDKDADELLQQVLRQKSGVTGPVDVEAEKRISEKVREVYRLHEKALSLVSEKRYEQAARAYEEVVLISPDDDEAYLLLGHTCLAAGDYKKAAGAFRSAIDIDPGNTMEIPRLYQNILVENPSDDVAMTRLGYAYLMLGGAKEARLAFEDALAVNPANLEARRGLLEVA